MGRAATTTEERALSLLGAGVTPEQVASALGVTVSRISQLCSDPEFTARVAELRFEALNKHNERDNRYDTLEDRLIAKLEDLLPLMMRPMEVLKSIQVINGAKRRGQSAPDQTINQQTVVSIVMPTTIVNKFVTNINNQVVKAGAQDLLTIQSGTLLKTASPAALPKGDTYEASRIASNSANTISAESREEPATQSLPARTQQEESRSYSQSSFVPVTGM